MEFISNIVYGYAISVMGALQQDSNPRNESLWSKKIMQTAQRVSIFMWAIHETQMETAEL